MIFFKRGDRVVSTVDGSHGEVVGMTSTGTVIVVFDYIITPRTSPRSGLLRQDEMEPESPLDFLARAVTP